MAIGPGRDVQQSGYDIYAALPAGYVLTRESEAALQAAYVANNFEPPSSPALLSAVEAVDGLQPIYPATTPIIISDFQSGGDIWWDK